MDTASDIKAALSGAVSHASSVIVTGNALAADAASIVGLVNFDSVTSKFSVQDSASNVQSNLSSILTLIGDGALTSVVLTSGQTVTNILASQANTLGSASTGYTFVGNITCLLYTSPSPRDGLLSRMPSSA